MKGLDNYRRAVSSASSRYDHARRTVGEEAERLEAARDLEKACREAQVVIQALAAEVQRRAHERVAALVSRCLAAVFDDPYTFHIHFDRKRGRTEARMVFQRGGLEVDPVTAAGGGVVDVAAFALRLSCLMLARPRVRPLLVLDEPFKMLSAGYVPRVAELQEALAKELGIQIIQVTHQELLRVGKVIELQGK